MSQSRRSDSPRTPRNRDSSTSLLAAFRSLTSSKAKQHPSAPSPAATSVTSPDSITSNPLDPASSVDHLSLSSGSLHQPHHVRDLPSVEMQSHGPPGLPNLLGDLQPERSIASRISAARAIAKLLEDYTGADVISIWERARSLLDERDSLEAADAAYRLLDACVSHKNLDPAEKAYLFESVSRNDDSRLFDARFRVIAGLSHHGRNTADLGFNFMVFLVHLLDSVYASTSAARKAKSRSSDDGSKNLDSHLLRVFDYILDVIKYNSKTFTEIDLDLLITHLRQLALTTTSVSDLSKAIEVIDSLTTYSCLPRESLPTCVELLCGAFAGVAQVRDITWQTVEHLLRSHLGPVTLTSLSTVLKDANTESNSNVVRGASQLLTKVLQSEEVPSPQPAHLPKLVSAARQSLATNSIRLDGDVMLLVLQLCSDPETAPTVFNEKVWDNIEEIVIHCAAHLTEELRVVESKAPGRPGSHHLTVAIQTLRDLAGALIGIADETNREQRRLVMRLLMQVAQLLEDSQAFLLIDYYSGESLLYPFSPDWHGDFGTLLNSIFKDWKRNANVRRTALIALCDAYRTGEALDTPKINELLLDVLRCLVLERESEVIEDLCDLAVDAATTTANMGLFSSVIALLREAVDAVGASLSSRVIHSQPGSSLKFALAEEKEPDILSAAATRSLVRVFLRCINSSAAKSGQTYQVLLAIAGSNDAPADARVESLKLLFRLRADTNHSIFVIADLECEDIAALICRTKATLENHNKVFDGQDARAGKSEDFIARRSSQHLASTSSTPRAVSRTNSGANKSPNRHGRSARSLQPLWLYPDLESLPEAPPHMSSHLLTSRHSRTEDNDTAEQRVNLDLRPWLELLLQILQQVELEWEVYSYVLVHLGAQLRNHALFVDAVSQIKFLRSVLNGQLYAKSYHEPPSNTNLKKADAAICLYQILTMLISYRKDFSKNEEDEMVRTFMQGIGSGERSSEMCIHALSMCCFELPSSLIRLLEPSLNKMSQIITQSHLAVHILEFLAGLARLPELIKNFREDEFRIVFRICFVYLQDVRESRAKASDGRASKAPAWHSRYHGMSGSTLVDDLPQYVTALAFHVMTFWFMACKMQDRHKHIPWITKSLAYQGPDGYDVLDERSQVTVDMMNRVAFSDRDETKAHDGFSVTRDGVTSTKTYLVGSSILTVETAGRTGISQITRRRPTATTYSTYAPNFVRPPSHQVPINVGLAAETFYHNDYVGVLPEHVFQQLYSPAGFPTTVLHLPEDDSIRRAISSFDRISPLDGHKAGIIYVGEGQTAEGEILSNVMGSSDYTYFLRHIGTLCELRDASFNTQGLDRSENETDGKFTFAWRDRVTEVVFHVTTMMPTIEHDPACTLKKRHIGNDYVNIIFNNSGSSWKIDNIPSDFNHVNIVITPEARASFVEMRTRGHHIVRQEHNEADEEVDPKQIVDPFAMLYYRVTVLTKPGIPAISPAHSTKIISGGSLPAFVRLLAMNASVFIDAWVNRADEEHATSSWRSRLREIKRLHQRLGSEDAAKELQRFGPAVHALPASQSAANGGGADATAEVTRSSIVSATSHPSSSSSLVNTRESVVFRRQSKPNIFGPGSDMTSRTSGYGSAQSVDMERSSSAGSGKN